MKDKTDKPKAKYEGERRERFIKFLEHRERRRRRVDEALAGIYISGSLPAKPEGMGYQWDEIEKADPDDIIGRYIEKGRRAYTEGYEAYQIAIDMVHDDLFTPYEPGWDDPEPSVEECISAWEAPDEPDQIDEGYRYFIQEQDNPYTLRETTITISLAHSLAQQLKLKLKEEGIKRYRSFFLPLIQLYLSNEPNMVKAFEEGKVRFGIGPVSVAAKHAERLLDPENDLDPDYMPYYATEDVELYDFRDDEYTNEQCFQEFEDKINAIVFGEEEDEDEDEFGDWFYGRDESKDQDYFEDEDEFYTEFGDFKEVNKNRTYGIQKKESQ
jgi:hypothetical protein